MALIEEPKGSDASRPERGDAAALAQELQALSVVTSVGEARSATLHGIETSLRRGVDLTRWADVDLYKVLDVDGPLRASADRRARGGLLKAGHLRTGLVFAPVLVTWAGLLFAGRAFGAMSAAGEVTGGSSFLELWLDGFGGRTIVTLDRVAAVAVCLILAAVLVSVLTDHHQEASRAREADSDRALRSRLTDLTSRVTLYLTPFRSGSTEMADKRLAAGLAEMSRLMSAMADLQQHVDRSAQLSMKASGASVRAIDASSSGVEAITRVSGELLLSVEQAAERHVAVTAAASRSLVDAVARLQDGCAEAVRESLHERGRILSSVDQLSDGVVEIAATSKVVGAELATSAEMLRQTGEDVMHAVQVHLAEVTGATAGAVDQIGTLLRSGTTELTALGAHHTEALNATAVQSLHKLATVTSEEVGQRFASCTEPLFETLVSMRDEARRSSRIAELALDSAGRVAAATAESIQLAMGDSERLGALSRAQEAAAVSWQQNAEELTSLRKEVSALEERNGEHLKVHGAHVERRLGIMTAEVSSAVDALVSQRVGTLLETVDGAAGSRENRRLQAEMRRQLATVAANVDALVRSAERGAPRSSDGYDGLSK